MVPEENNTDGQQGATKYRPDPLGLCVTLLACVQRLDQLEARIEKRLTTHDQAIAGILEAIRELMRPPETKKRPIGFVVPEENKKGG